MNGQKEVVVRDHCLKMAGEVMRMVYTNRQVRTLNPKIISREIFDLAEAFYWEGSDRKFWNVEVCLGTETK